MLCSCGTPGAVCTKHIDVTGYFSIMRHWMFVLERAGSSHHSLFHFWGVRQHRDGKVCSSQAGWLGPACWCTWWLLTWSPSNIWVTPNNHSVVTIILCYFSYPFWMQPPHQESCNINSPQKRCAATDLTLTSLLADFTWPLVRLSPKTVNVLSAQQKGFTDWPFSEHLHCSWRQSIGPIGTSSSSSRPSISPMGTSRPSIGAMGTSARTLGVLWPLGSRMPKGEQHK